MLAATSSVKKVTPEASMSLTTTFAIFHSEIFSFGLESARCLVSFLLQKTMGSLRDRSSAGWHSTWW
jgi:hypothetical protein